MFFVPAATLVFSAAYAGITLSKGLVRLIYFLQSAAVLVIYTDRFHHLVRKSLAVVRRGANHALLVETTTLGKVMASFNFLYIIVSFVILLSFFFFTSQNMRKQVFCVISGMGIPVAYALFKAFSNKTSGVTIPISGVFALSDLFILLGIMKYDFLMAAPIARNEVFNVVDDGIVIAAASGRIIDVNPAALKIFKPSSSKTFAGHQCIEFKICRDYPEWYEALSHGQSDKFEILIGDEQKSYLCEVYILKNRHERSFGSISVLRDISEQKRQTDLLKLRAETDELTGILNGKPSSTRLKTSWWIPPRTYAFCFSTSIILKT